MVQFLKQLRSYASLPCIRDESISYSYDELLREVELWRARFDQLSIEQGTVVALRSDYSLQAVAILLALLACGAIVALIPRQGSVDSYLADSCATGLIEPDHIGGYLWRDVACATAHPLVERLRATGGGGIVIFTSGSTGRPKAALHSAEYFLHKFLRPRRRLRTLACLLFDHVAGLDTLLYSLASGSELILTRRRDPAAILRLIESSRVELLPASASLLRLLCKAWRPEAHDVSSLKIITYGSETMDASTLRRLNLIFPSTQIRQKYGTTETGSPPSQSRGNDSLWLSIRADGTETKVVAGVLWMRSDRAMLGYLNAPSPIDEEGWYCTGDEVEVDGEWIRFIGRATDTINVGGEKVDPVEVEQSILELDFVKDVVVTHKPHALLGEVVSARVALSRAMEPKEAARKIRLHCRQQLAPHKMPVQIELTDDDLAEGTVTARGKRVRT